MNFTETELPGVILVEPNVHGDDRGFFLETYHAEKYAAGGISATFVQDNHSRSRQGILRGLHLQLAFPQGKLVRVVEGEVYDVAVDVRRGSPHFGKHVAVVLSAESFAQLYVPPGFAHGFLVTSEVAQFEYKCTNLYHPEDELSIAWNDPELAIRWPIAAPSLAAKDAEAATLAEAMDRLPVYRPAED
ncbi:MAG: dTDP-4-dehydrorhamnose 3,5-epimerase [Myxococcota bacterium]